VSWRLVNDWVKVQTAIDTKMVQIEPVFLRRMAARSMGASAMPDWLYSPQRHRRPHPWPNGPYHRI
jgi:hypothetical protein